MQIKYLVNKIQYKVIFCPDREGLKIKKKKKSYTTVANDLLKIYNDKKILLIIDKKIDKKVIKYLVHDLKISFPNLHLLLISGSKKNKNLSLLFKIIDTLFENKFTKKSVIVSCGGGVIGDVSGLASSLYLRGLIHFHIPTTMTAIIDSCIGGKTGINYKEIINSIGTYYHAEKVYISKNIINLLPEREFIAGLPEILKCGLIHNKKILKLLLEKKKFLERNFSFLSQIIKYSLESKIKYFKNDVTEEGERLKLNFGHTFAHAIEMSLEANKSKELLRHGEAVGLGLLCEIYYAFGKNRSFNLTKKILNEYNLPINLKKFVNKKNKKKLQKMIYKSIFLDKKRIGKFPRYIKLLEVGKSRVSEMQNFNRIKQTINKILF
tara:strand:- start:8038 stop:9174 length:1137 start_codon:yes stop_codon:yes gene_type:complete